MQENSGGFKPPELFPSATCMMKKDVTIDYFDPARTTLTRRDSLNILLIASNHTDTPLCPEITIYGDDGEQTVPLYSRAQPLPGHGHEHLYFRLPEGWAQAVAGAEEVRLFAAAGDVTGKEKSKLLFLTD